MTCLAEILERHREEIMSRWGAEARKAAAGRGLSKPELTDVLPLYLSALSGSDDPEHVQCRLESHVASRTRQGCELSELVEELILLEQCFTSVWLSLPAAEQPSEAERISFLGAVQRTIVRVTELFDRAMQLEEQRENRYLRLLQTIADEAIRKPETPLTFRFKDVLRLTLEAMDAEAASLLLYDPEANRLVTVASAGLAEAELEQLTTSIAPSALGGAIASGSEPTTIDDLATTELEIDDSLRQSGLHSLLGIRLPPRDGLFGVLYVALRERREFSRRELRRLEGLGNSLMTHLANAKLYEELRGRIDDLGLESNLRERFVAILAHDLRGPLSAARLSSQLLVRHPKRADRRRDLAARVQHHLDRMDGMIRDLLDVSRVRAGQRLPLRLERCELCGLAAQVIEELSATHGPRFRLEVVASGGVSGNWSSEELRRALWNLLENAVKYGAADQPITLRVERTDSGARAVVHNFGTPIAPEDQPRLFDVYGRLKAPQRRAGSGWGLGLAYVRACAEAHGGRIDVESSAEAGTSFILELPPDSGPYQPSVSR